MAWKAAPRLGVLLQQQGPHAQQQAMIQLQQLLPLLCLQPSKCFATS
jgi:hypothetical protein